MRLHACFCAVLTKILQHLCRQRNIIYAIHKAGKAIRFFCEVGFHLCERTFAFRLLACLRVFLDQ